MSILGYFFRKLFRLINIEIIMEGNIDRKIMLNIKSNFQLMQMAILIGSLWKIILKRYLMVTDWRGENGKSKKRFSPDYHSHGARII